MAELTPDELLKLSCKQRSQYRELHGNAVRMEEWARQANIAAVETARKRSQYAGAMRGMLTKRQGGRDEDTKAD